MNTVINGITVSISNYNNIDIQQLLLDNIIEQNEIIKKIHDIKKQNETKPFNAFNYLQTNGIMKNQATHKNVSHHENMSKIINDLANKTKMQSKWVECCDGFIELWNAELYSTSYMICLICHSFMNIQGNIKIIIDLTNSKGNIFEWDIIQHYITITIDKNNTDITNNTRRAIVGLGPSGCGKSFMAKKLLPILDITNVCSIDGGLSREHSIAWQLVTSDKMITGLYDKFTFDNKIHARDIVLKFIRKFDISVYIPETAAGDLFGRQKLQTINIDELDQNWIFLYVWQHLNNSVLGKCNFPHRYKCTGCDVSGKKREKSEGKSYNSSAYQFSLKAANNYLKTHKGERIFVHNSGSDKNKSVVWSNIRKYLEKFDSNNYVRIQSQCTYIHKTLTDTKIKLSLKDNIYKDTDTDVPPTFVIVSHNTRIQCLLNTCNGEEPEQKIRFKHGCIIKIVINDNITWTLEYEGELTKETTEPYYQQGAELCTKVNAQNLPSCCIYLVRHGEGTHNTGWYKKTKFDAPLTQIGILQAKKTGKRLITILQEQKPDMWFVSDLQRTHQTLNNMLTDTPFDKVVFHVLPCSYEVVSNCKNRGHALENTPTCKNKCLNIDKHIINWSYHNDTKTSKNLCKNSNMLQIATEMYQNVQNTVLYIGQQIITSDELEILKTSELPNGLIILNAQNNIINLTNVMYITPLNKTTPYMIKINDQYYQGTGVLPDDLITKIELSEKSASNGTKKRRGLFLKRPGSRRQRNRQ